MGPGPGRVGWHNGVPTQPRRSSEQTWWPWADWMGMRDLAMCCPRGEADRLKVNAREQLLRTGHLFSVPVGRSGSCGCAAGRICCAGSTSVLASCSRPGGMEASGQVCSPPRVLLEWMRPPSPPERAWAGQEPCEWRLSSSVGIRLRMQQANPERTGADVKGSRRSGSQPAPAVAGTWGVNQ